MVQAKDIKIKEDARFNSLKQCYESSISLLKAIDELSAKLEVRNTQEFINWQDEINKISVK